MKKCIGFRQRSLCTYVGHNLIFIDPRALGKPVCCRLFAQSLFRAEDFLGAIDVRLPAGFKVQFTGGTPVADDPLHQRCGHCSSVVLWVVGDFGSPDSPCIGAPDGADDDASDNGTESSDDDMAENDDHAFHADGSQHDGASQPSGFQSSAGGSATALCQPLASHSAFLPSFASRVLTGIPTPRRNEARKPAHRSTCPPRVHLDASDTHRASGFSRQGAAWMSQLIDVTADHDNRNDGGFEDETKTTASSEPLWTRPSRDAALAECPAADTSDSPLPSAANDAAKPISCSLPGETGSHAEWAAHVASFPEDECSYSQASAPDLGAILQLDALLGGTVMATSATAARHHYLSCVMRIMCEEAVQLGAPDFAAEDMNVPEASRAQPCVVHLDSLIPSSPTHEPLSAPMTAFSCPTGFVPALKWDLTQFVPWSALLVPPAGLSDEGRFQEWVHHGRVGRVPQAEEVVAVTSDASFQEVNDGSAGWGLVFSIRNAQDRSSGVFIGCAYGCAGDTMQAAIGTRACPDAHLAETCGLPLRLFSCGLDANCALSVIVRWP